MQGLQNVAQKLMMVGLSEFFMAASKSCSFHFLISCALAVDRENADTIIRINLLTVFII